MEQDSKKLGEEHEAVQVEKPKEKKELDVVARLAPTAHLRTLQQILGTHGRSDAEIKNKQVLDPDHPQMIKFQKDFHEHLLKLHQETDEQLHDLTRVVNDQEKANDAVGKHMCDLQKEVVQLKKSLTKYETIYEKLQEKKSHSSKKLAEVKENHKSSYQMQQKERQKDVILQKELEDLSLEIVQLRDLQLSSYSDSSTMKRTLQKTTKEREELEIEKLRQDMLINRLEVDKNRLEDRISLYKSQSAIKREELADIKKVLSVATSDIQAIQFEKLQLMQQWNYSISSLEKRDLTGATMRESVRLYEDNMRTLNMDIVSLKKSVRKEMDENDKIYLQLLQKDSEVAQTEKLIADCHERQQSLEEEYSFFEKVISHTEEELLQLGKEKKQKEKEWETKAKELETLMLTQRKLEENYMEALHEKITTTKESRINEKLVKDCRKKIENLARNTVLKEGEEARIQMRLGDTESHLQEMQETIAALQKGCIEKENTITKSEAEIVKGHDCIQKKQTYILEINNKLTALISEAGGQELGPMEREIANIKKEISNAEQLRKTQEQQWLRHQRTLVSLTNESTLHFKGIEKMRREEALLEAKKVHVAADLCHEEREIKNLNREIERVQNDMAHLTAVLHREKVSEERLEHEAEMMRGDFANMLKGEELAFMKKENEVESLKKHRSRLVHKLEKAQIAIALWEEKMKLADETRAIMKSESHAEEIANYESEIRRLQYRSEQIEKEEASLIGLMERAAVQYANLYVRADYQCIRGIKKKSKHYLNTKTERLKIKILEDKKKLENISEDIKSKNSLMFDMKKSEKNDLDASNDLKKQIALVTYDCKNKEREKLQAIIRLSYKHKKNKLLQQMKDKKYIWAKRDMQQRAEEAKQVKKNIFMLNSIVEPIISVEPNVKNLATIQDHVVVSLEF